MDGRYFISYSRVDAAEFAQRMADELVAGPPSYPVWLDVRDERLAGLLPGARLVELPRAAHLPTLERPRELSGMLTGFLRETVPALCRSVTGLQGSGSRWLSGNARTAPASAGSGCRSARGYARRIWIISAPAVPGFP